MSVNGKAKSLIVAFHHPFLCFFMYLHINKELNRVVGTLYELDGMKDGPIKHRSCSSISLLQVLQVYEMVLFFPLFCTSFSISLNWLLKLLTVKFKGNG